MYTTYPVPPVDTLHSHVGFFAICFIAAIVVWIMHEEGVEDEHYVKRVLLAAFLAVAGYNSFTTGVMVTCDNEQVIADFITFIPEANKSGKSVTHKVYSLYRVENTNIVFEAGNQAANRVYLYKNTKPECKKP